jgi:succinoglycan biosynthesis protein ExoA
VGARGQGAWGRAIAAAFQSRWVVGGARSRVCVDFEGEVDTVYLGCWPRATLERVGGFDETLVRNQDDEHNLRIARPAAVSGRARASAPATQPRGSLRQLFGQQLQYGYWRPFVLRKHRQAGSVRQLVPMVFIAACALCAVLAPAFHLGLVALLGLYAAYLLTASVLAARQARELGLAWRLPLVIAAYHLGYGLGGWRGLWDIWRGRVAPAAVTRLTR